MSIILKQRTDLNRATLVTLDQNVLVENTLATLRMVAPGINFALKTVARDKSHTKAAGSYGGGETYRHTFRSDQSVIVNRDTLFPQVTIVDRTFSGAALRAYIGFFRVVCSNGLVIPAGEAINLTVNHRLSSEKQLRELHEVIGAAWGSVTAAQEKLVYAASVKVDAARVISQLDMFSEVQRADLTRSLLIARAEDDTTTVAGLYQHINETDRKWSRLKSTAHLERDVKMLDTILEIAA